MGMDDKELEHALKCDAAVPPEARGVAREYVVSNVGHKIFVKSEGEPVFGHEQAEALFANLVDRVVALEAEVAALKAAKV